MNIIRKILIWWLERQKQPDGRFPEDIFYASARIFGEACLDLLIFRYPPNKKQIFLYRRANNDPFYPSLLHIPGTRKLPDDTNEMQLLRIIQETGLSIDWRDIRYCYSTTTKYPRGTIYDDIRAVTIPYNENDIGFYDVENLPDDMIKQHKEIVCCGGV